LYNYCLNCEYKTNSKCLKCTNDILFHGLNVISTEKTLDEIIKHKKSIARLSDGEFNLIFGRSLTFQEYDYKLSRKLFKIIKNNHKNKNILIGIDFVYKKEALDLYRQSEVDYWTDFYQKYRFDLLRLLDKSKIYYSSDITRFYHKFKDKSHVPKHIKKLKKIWEGRDILIVEGEKSRIGIGNDLFNNTKSIKRILCPPENAFRVYNKIINKFKKLRIPKSDLILISLGPVASILSYDLCKMGYQALDIGHADIEYEIYLRKYNEIKRIPYKYVNQAKDGRKNIQNIRDENYYKQILAKILN
jgi:glycosyltransferase family protein